MRSRVLLTVLLFAGIISAPGLLATRSGSQECTTAIFTGEATADGRPMLWKNRDTDQLSNKVVFVDDRPYSYLAW